MARQASKKATKKAAAPPSAAARKSAPRKALARPKPEAAPVEERPVTIDDERKIARQDVKVTSEGPIINDPGRSLQALATRVDKASGLEYDPVHTSRRDRERQADGLAL